MPFRNSKPYVKWSERKRRELLLVKPVKPSKPRVVRVPVTSACQQCGKEFTRIGGGKFCGRSCHCTANSRAIREWEQAVGAELEKDGWEIFRPMSCCDRIGVKDGHLFFLEFKPKGQTALRKYQQLVRDTVPHMYQVVVSPFGSPSEVEIVSIHHPEALRKTRRRSTLG